MTRAVMLFAFLASSPVEQEVLHATRQIFDAISRLDLEQLEKLLSDDYHYTSWHGEALTKQQRLASLRALVDHQESEAFSLSELRVHLLSDGVAVVVGRAHQTGRYQGTPFDNHYRFTTVFRREGASWLAAVHQVTRIESP